MIANAKAIVSCVYLAVNVSLLDQNTTPAPSCFVGAEAKPLNITSSSKALSDVSVVENLCVLIFVSIIFQAEQGVQTWL